MGNALGFGEIDIQEKEALYREKAPPADFVVFVCSAVEEVCMWGGMCGEYQIAEAAQAAGEFMAHQAGSALLSSNSLASGSWRLGYYYYYYYY